MDSPTKVLIAGVFVSALTLGLGQLDTRRLERRVEELQKACVAEAEAEAKRQGPLFAFANVLGGKMQCDPPEVAKSGNHTGVQGQLAAAELARSRWAGWPLILSSVLLLTCSLPWLWYFFLRRIRELREAILGK